MKIPTILIVDDDRQIARMFRSSLELSGRDYTVIDVPSAEEALLELGQTAADLVVSDLRLPGMSGLELLAAVRARNPLARAIMITAHPSEAVREQAQQLGVVAFMTKPIHTNAFLEVVDRVLTVQQQELHTEALRTQQITQVTPHIQRLQKAVGAAFVILAGPDAETLTITGDTGGYDPEALQPILAETCRLSGRLSASLGASSPWNIHYFSGIPLNLYMVTGIDLVLLIGISMESDYGQIGSVARHARKTISELRPVFSGEDADGGEKSGLVAVLPPEEDELQEKAIKRMVKPGTSGNANQFWENVQKLPGAAGEIEGETFSYEQARQIGLIDGNSEAHESAGSG
jgi:CheY-like chemotaxis protein